MGLTLFLHFRGCSGRDGRLVILCGCRIDGFEGVATAHRLSSGSVGGFATTTCTASLVVVFLHVPQLRLRHVLLLVLHHVPRAAHHLEG